MKEWWVRLQGEQFDLQELPLLFSSPEVTVFEEEGEYYLKSTEFNSLADASYVLETATHILELINGAAILHFGNFRPVQASGSVIGIDEDGSRKGFVFVSATLTSRARVQVSATVERANGTVESCQRPTQVESWVALARQNTAIADALHFFCEHTWFNLYKVYEIVRDDVGGKREIIHNGWVTKQSLKRFTQTAQSRDALGDDARHASEKYKPPQKPISLSEARSLVATILENWIRSKQ